MGREEIKVFFRDNNVTDGKVSERPGLRERFRELLTIRDTPHRVAATFAAGLFLGISPLLGVHTVMALVVAWIFRLNKVVILTGVFVTNPWSIVPIYSFCIWVGILLLGTENINPGLQGRPLSMIDLYGALGNLMMPFVVGTVLVGTVSSALSYFVVKGVIQRAVGPSSVKGDER
jgi:uncharacterized protein (DUF2062 family)